MTLAASLVVCLIWGSKEGVVSDPLLKLEENGGDLVFTGGDVEISNGLESAVVLSLFGGNEQDDATQATEQLQYWGNLLTDDTDEWLRSRTQAALRGLPANTASLLVLKDAVENDLDWMKGDIVTDFSVSVELTSVRRVAITVDMIVNEQNYSFRLTREWGGTK